MKSPRNKTIDLPPEQCGDYLAACLSPTGPLSASAATDQTICGDFFTVAPLLPDAAFRLVIADPPYNLTKVYAGETFYKTDAVAYADFTRRWLAEVRRLLTPDGSTYVCADWQTGVILAPLLSDFFTVRSRITWQREKGRGAAKNWKNCLEDVWFCTVSDDYYFDLNAVKMRRAVKAPYRENGEPKDWTQTEAGKTRLTCPSNFWDDLTVPFWSMPENTAHPTQKPEKLFAKLVLASSAPGDLILDPFAGSGTTAVVAKKLGRRFTTVEKSELYCAWTRLRLENAEKDPRIQGYENGEFLKK